MRSSSASDAGREIAVEEMAERARAHLVECGLTPRPAAAEAELQATERRLGARLPAAMRALYRVMDGTAWIDLRADDPRSLLRIWPLADLAVGPERDLVLFADYLLSSHEWMVRVGEEDGEVLLWTTPLLPFAPTFVGFLERIREEPEAIWAP